MVSSRPASGNASSSMMDCELMFAPWPRELWYSELGSRYIGVR